MPIEMKKKLLALLADCDIESPTEFTQDWGHENDVPGVCMSEGCDYVQIVDREECAGHCLMCGERAIKSGLKLIEQRGD